MDESSHCHETYDTRHNRNRTVLDDSVHPEQAASILKNLRAANSDRKPRPGTIKQAAAILEVHPVTVRRYAQAGLLTPIRITSRKVRYDLNQVAALALRGGLDI